MTAASNNSWVTCWRPNPQARLRLFCLPYAGGGASVFRTWPDHLPWEVEVCPVQFPGRENRLGETPLANVPALAQALAQAICPHLDLPFALFGHSLGALVGFELARQLRRQNAPGPAHLFVSGSRAPQLPDPVPPIHQLPEAEFVEALRGYNGTPEAVLQSAELMQLLFPLLRADFCAAETYAYSADAPLDCPVSAFGGLQDALVGRELVAAWREQTREAFTLHMLPGDHFFLHDARSRFLQTLSQGLVQVLHG